MLIRDFYRRERMAILAYDAKLTHKAEAKDKTRYRKADTKQLVRKSHYQHTLRQASTM